MEHFASRSSAFAEKIRTLIETTPIPTQAGPIRTTVSIGVCGVPHSRIHSSKDLIVAADKALYRAKKSGRNQVQSEKRRDQTPHASGQAEPMTAGTTR